MEVFTAVVFLAATGVTALLAASLLTRRGLALRRLAAKPSVTDLLPSPVLIWHELVARAGNILPASAKDLSELKRRLVRAGLRNPAVARLWQGARPVGAMLFAAMALFSAVHSHAPVEKILLRTAVGGLVGYSVPGRYLSWRIARRKRAIGRGLPNALDLMVVCVESGLGIDQTTLQVAKELRSVHPEICDEFTAMNVELRAGRPRSEALHNMANRTGLDEIKKLVAVLVQSDRFGTGVAQTLRGHSEYLRVLARQRAEERASKLAVKLVFPIFFCILPSLFVVTIGPVLTHLIRDLIPMIENM